MSSIYTPCPALKYDGSYLVLRSIEKRVYAFLRCHASRFPLTGDEAQAALAGSEVFATPDEFREASARLPVNAVLSPIEGGSSVVLYLARPGKEEDFKEIVPDLQEEADIQLVQSLPDQEAPLVLVFADPAEVAAWTSPPPEAAAPPQPESEPAPAAAESAPEPEPADARPEAEVAAAEPQPEPAPPPAAAAAPVAAEPQAEAAPAPSPTAETEVAAEVVQEPEPTPQAEAPPTPPPAAPAIEAEPEPAPAAEPDLPAADTSTRAEPSAAATEAEPAAPAVEEPEAKPPPPTKLKPTPPPEPAPPPVKSPAALVLGQTYFALRAADTTGSTVVVWQARRLAAIPSPDEFEIITPSGEARQRLIAEAQARVSYADEGLGELVAIKIARPGREADLERAALALRRLGSRALRLHYPGPGPGDQTWLPDFPCMAVEWASGWPLNETPAFSEVRGLEVCYQLADLLAAARQAAPDIVLTDSLKPSNIVVVYDQQGGVSVRIIDWNVYATDEGDVRATTLIRFGELMLRVFAPDMPFAVDWTAPAPKVPLHLLGAGRPDDPGAAEWDALSHGTRTIIRRALQGQFEGDADSIVGDLRQAIKGQQACWAENDPTWQARQASGPARLNWLDIAAVRQGRASAEARARLDENRRRELREIVDDLTDAGRHLEAVIELYRGVRLHPDDAHLRWALLAHSVAALGPERAFQRLHLDEGLSHLAAGRYLQGQMALERGQALFDDQPWDPARREQAHEYLQALALCAQTCALADSAMEALAEDWRVEDAEFRLAQGEEMLRQSEQLARRLLSGRDPVGQRRMDDLRRAIADFYDQHERYDPAAARRDKTAQERQASFDHLLGRARSLAQKDDPDVWRTALHIFDRAADEFPDLWRDVGQHERDRLREKLARRQLDEARRALSGADWSSAATALAGSVLHPATRDEALRLQAALAAYQRGEVEARRGDPAAALSFAYAAEHSAELMKRAQDAAASAKKAAEQQPGAPAPPEAIAAAVKLDTEGLSQELNRQFAEQQTFLMQSLQEAASASQEQSAERQMAALKLLQTEQWDRQQSALKQLQDAQADRLKTTFAQLQGERLADLQEMLKDLNGEQLAQLKATLITLNDEHSEWLRGALKKLQDEAPARQEAALAQLQDELLTRQQTALKQLQGEASAQQQSTLEELQKLRGDVAELAAQQRETSRQAPKAQELGSDTETRIRDMGYQVEDTAARQRTLAKRTGQILALNILLLLALCGLATLAGVAWLGRLDLTGGAPAPAPTATAIPPTPLPATAAPAVLPTATAAPPTPAPTATAQFGAGLDCVDADKARSYYDCVVRNTAAAPDALSLSIVPDGGRPNGFNPSVTIENQGTTLPDRNTQLVALGEFDPGQSQKFRLSVTCLVSTGCAETTFIVTVLIDRGTMAAPGGELRLTTRYFPPQP